MLDQFSRTRILLGNEAMDRLAGARVAVFGVGGVGSYAAEALVPQYGGAVQDQGYGGADAEHQSEGRDTGDQ